MNTIFQTPEEIRQHIWKELGRATHDRHHSWRTPVLATATDDGYVNARTVVLRRVDALDQVLEIYTDHRSSKVAELTAQPLAYLVFWSPRLHWQLRVRAKWSVHTTGADVASRWQAVRQTRSAGDYMSNLHPGASLPEDGSGAQGDAFTRNIDENYFAILQAHVVEIDWLELGRQQHRRAKLIGETWQWLNP